MIFLIQLKNSLMLQNLNYKIFNLYFGDEQKVIENSISFDFSLNEAPVNQILSSNEN